MPGVRRLAAQCVETPRIVDKIGAVIESLVLVGVGGSLREQGFSKVEHNCQTLV